MAHELPSFSSLPSPLKTTTITTANRGIMEPSSQELVAAIRQAVQDTPSLKSKFNATVEFRFDDVAELVDISKKGSSDPDLVVTTSLPVFHQLLNKKLTPQQAFMQGKLKIKGKVRVGEMQR
ncbi:MAG: hypothetical protein SGILL_009514, partial [Bacillariaceae sp.]